MKNNRRVVVVGAGLRTPIGNTLDQFAKSLKERRSGICVMPAWNDVKRMRTRLAGLCHIEGEEESIPRQYLRSMGRVAILAALSAMDAVKASGLTEEEIASPICGVSYGSTEGSIGNQMEYLRKMLLNRSLEGIPRILVPEMHEPHLCRQYLHSIPYQGAFHRFLYRLCFRFPGHRFGV